jgi:UDP-glucose 4-epimerase
MVLWNRLWKHIYEKKLVKKLENNPMPSYKTALVTGGAGFIGSHIVDALIRRRIRVYVIDDLSTGLRSNVNPNARFIQMSVTSPRLPSVLRKIKPDVIFHLAAQADLRCSVQDPPNDARTNILGTLALAHVAGRIGVKKFIFTSTGGALYSDDIRPPYSEAVSPCPISPYGIAKRCAEMYLEYECNKHNLKTVVLRLSNVYGPRQAMRGEAGVISIFARRMSRGEQVIINGDGKNTRDYVYVSDVVDAQMYAMSKQVSGVFHIGTGRETSVNAIFYKMNKIIGGKMKETHGPACEGEVKRSSLDARKARRELGWAPKVKLEEGLLKTVAWFQKLK